MLAKQVCRRTACTPAGEHGARRGLWAGKAPALESPIPSGMTSTPAMERRAAARTTATSGASPTTKTPRAARLSSMTR